MIASRAITKLSYFCLVVSLVLCSTWYVRATVSPPCTTYNRPHFVHKPSRHEPRGEGTGQRTQQQIAEPSSDASQHLHKHQDGLPELPQPEARQYTRTQPRQNSDRPQEHGQKPKSSVFLCLIKVSVPDRAPKCPDHCAHTAKLHKALRNGRDRRKPHQGHETLYKLYSICRRVSLPCLPVSVLISATTSAHRMQRVLHPQEQLSATNTAS
jgi:hypothetical protein